MLSIGSVVAGYRIERLLGVGGMGEVYLASHPSLPHYDALKVLSAELSSDPDFRGRFVREADVAARLDHPNIVSIHNRGQTDEGQLWIAMQYVDGTDADKALVPGAMTPARPVHIITEVAKALDYAGERNVVHRDVKPANFLLAGTVGSEERVLLGDFGIARALGPLPPRAATQKLAELAAVSPAPGALPVPAATRSVARRLGTHRQVTARYRALTGGMRVRSPAPGHIPK